MQGLATQAWDAELATRVETDGFVVVSDFVSSPEVADLRHEVDRLLAESPARGGVRNALGKSARLYEFATRGALARAAVSLLGPAARPVKLTIFDKTARSNWKVPWHQDLTISVKERVEVAGFGPWSVKDGIPHVQPPAAVLERVVAIRLHLDDTGADNGPLRVLPGTHRLGRTAETEIESLRQRIPEVVCTVPAGGAMAMRPLLLHASSAAVSPSRRRVLHFELSDVELPDGLCWT
jgi:ectoine hydroxylase-related dioxygenase (phytanoyl-CoA dioxygenase family)